MSTIGVVILAAGGSSRLGSPKQLLVYEGKSLLRRACDTALAAGFSSVNVVVGANAAQCQEELLGLRVQSIYNPNWKKGISSSICVGVLAVCDEVDAVLLMLCDQPLLVSDHLETLAKSHVQSPNFIVASEYGGVLGVPALFPRVFFNDLLDLQGEHGARQIIGLHKDKCMAVPYPEGSFDIDTLNDYEFLSKKTV